MGYPDLIDYRQPAEWYLDKAYNIYYNRVGEWEIGFYGEQQVPQIIEALREEGMTEEADNLQEKFALRKGTNMANAAYPYGSEFEYDNTGEAGEQCYVSGNEGIAYAVIPAGGSAEITIEKMDGGENQAPKIYSVEAEEEPQALVPFRVEASAYDDGAPDGTLTYKWEVTDAPEGAELTFDADDNPYAEVSAALDG